MTAKHNQCPGLYCDKSETGDIPYSKEQMATVKTGAGGGNIRFYFCDPDGRIVLRVTGFVDGREFADEEELARLVVPRPELAPQALRFAPTGPLFPWHEIRRKDRACAALGRPIRDVLRQVEDEIYTKGAIG